MDMDKVQNNKKKVLIACPYDESIHGSAYDNHMEFIFRMGRLEDSTPYKFAYATVGGLFVPLARERIIEAALNDNFDYLFMYDSARDVDIVAPLAFMRRPPYMPVIFMQSSGIEDGKPWFKNHTIKNYPKNTLFECDAVGFGAVLIKLDIVKNMPKPYFMSTCGTGEDILFCYNAKEYAGAKVFCDTSIKLGHLASRSQWITEETYEQHNKVDMLREFSGDYTKEKANAGLPV